MRWEVWSPYIQESFEPGVKTKSFQRETIQGESAEKLERRWSFWRCQLKTSGSGIGWHFTALRNNTDGNTGDLLVPNDYVCQGKRLGAWIGTQRMEYKSRTNPRFTQARVDLLNAIGMVWDVRQFQWNRMYQALERYLQKAWHGAGPSVLCHRGGGQAGNLAKQGSHGVQTGTLVPGATGPVRGPGRGLGARSSAQGELGAFFALLEDYVVCNGTFPPATYQTEAGVKLGIWLSNQKQDRKNGALAPDRLQKLEALGVIWDVPEQAWMDRYRQAEAYFQCHGHLCPYQRRNAPLPAGLSQWLTAQRKAKQAGKLSPEKSRMLESVGMIWDVYQSLWETAYQQAGSIRSAPRAFAGLQGQWAGPVFRALDQHPAKKLQKGGPERGTDPKAGDPWNGVGCRGRFGRAVGTVVSKKPLRIMRPTGISIPWRESCVLGCWPSGRQRKESAAA